MLSIPHLSSTLRRYRPTDDDSATHQTALRCNEASSTALAIAPRRARRRVSKNCKTLLKYGYMYRGFQRAGDLREQRMSDELQRVQEQVTALERQRALLESVYFSRHANVRQVAADQINQYYQHFAFGFDPSSSPDRSRLLESIVRSVLQPNVQSPAFQTIDQFLKQWANYSKYHSRVTVTVQSIQPLDDESSDAVIVKCTGITTFRISRDTITHFFQPIMNDENLVQQLIGKEYCFPFATLFHFSTDTGRVFRLEPRADLATGLLNLVADPFSTVRLLDASQLTSEGCLHAYEDEEVPPPAVAA